MLCFRHLGIFHLTDLMIVTKEVKEAMIAVGTASERKALLEERRLSFEASGGQLDDEGRVGLAISFDELPVGFGSCIGLCGGLMDARVCCIRSTKSFAPDKRVNTGLLSEALAPVTVRYLSVTVRSSEG